MTTFLAVIILPFSSSHVFLTFFKIFGLTVCYGVFHGLVFLPTLLSTIGPSGSEVEQQSGGNPNNNSATSTTSEQTATFLAQERKQQAEKKRSGINTLITHSFLNTIFILLLY